MFCIMLTPLARGEAQNDWKAEWEKTVAAAKKEGRVVIYHGSGTYEIFQSFQKKYPEIKFVPLASLIVPSFG